MNQTFAEIHQRAIHESRKMNRLDKKIAKLEKKRDRAKDNYNACLMAVGEPGVRFN